MKKKSQLVFVVLILIHISLGLYSQNSKDPYKELTNLLGHIANTLMHNQVQYTPSVDFDLHKRKSNNEERLTFLRSDKYTYYEHGVWDKLISKDGNFITFIDVPPVYSKDSIYVYMPLAPYLKEEINTYHLDWVKGDFFCNTGERIHSFQNLPIHYKSPGYAQMAFNADTVITYPLKVWHKYKNKYNYCQVMIIQKNGRGFIRLVSIYNDEGKKKLDSYIKSLEGVFWYRDPKDYIEFVDSEEDSITVIQGGNKKTLTH